MPEIDQRPGSSWNLAAGRLASRVNRRERVAILARCLGWGLLIAAALGLGWRALGNPGADSMLGARGTVVGLLVAGQVAGLLAGLGALRRAPRVAPGDAAWALDRLGEADGRGLTAAVAQGPAASEAAWAEPALAPPPAVRLLPPGGLVLGVAALLLAALAVLAAGRKPEPAPPPVQPDGDTARVGRSGGAGGSDPAAQARAADNHARTLDQRVEEAGRVRAALNLPADGPLDPKEVAQRLQDPERRRAAARAASDGTALSESLGRDDATPEALARLLEQSELDRAGAARSRRAAADARAQAAMLPVPPGRRAVVTQYLQLIE